MPWAGLNLGRVWIPRPSRRWIQFLKPKAAIVVVVLMTALALSGFLWFSLMNMPVARNEDSSPVTVNIGRGETSLSIGRLLKEKRLVRSGFAFRVISKIGRFDGRLKAGTYALKDDMSLTTMLGILRSGKVVRIRFTIPEGYTLAQVAGLLSAKGYADKERFLALAAGKDPDFRPTLAGQGLTGSLEGYLFPDTYEFASGVREEDIISGLLRRFEHKVLPEYERKATGQSLTRRFTLREIIILASIVEKEAKVDRERPLIAAVFYNRLKKGMPLQSCATIQYILGHPKARLSYKDLTIDSPYNTYLHVGLPPGPISNPGLSSILAVLSPAGVDYLYFSANRDGTHRFAKTFREHVAMKDRNQAPGRGER